MLKLRTVVTCLALIMVASLPALAQTDDAATQGIVTDKPSEGRFVDLGNGKFMVPYTATIPGTEIEFSMVPIPGGEFLMGNADGDADQKPTFKVRVEPFWMAKHEVTWEEYTRFMDMEWIIKDIQAAGKRIVEDKSSIDAFTCPSPLYDASHTYDEGDEPEQAAATMTQFAAKQYTKWLSLSTAGSDLFYRLPYECEWEYACRAGTDTKFYFGDDEEDLKDHAWCKENSDKERQYVCELEANPWGLYDMYGNVAEWTLDQYNEKGHVQAADKEADAVLSVQEAYNKPTTLYPRSTRGGSFLDDGKRCNSFAKLASNKDWRIQDPNRPQSPWWLTTKPASGVGFRIVRQYSPATRKQKEAVWSADVDSIMLHAAERIDAQGKGSIGIVDDKLHEDVAEVE